MTPKISVVVPAYNVGKFVAECLESILSQDFDAFEIVVVDDGSPDDSGKICDEFAARDARVRVFHKENGGVSAARKFGTERSRGEWICFVDGDDALPPNALSALFAGTQKFPDADIVEGGSTEFRESAELRGRGVPVPAPARSREPFDGSGLEYAREVASRRGLFSLAPWRKLIRREVLLKTAALDVPRKINSSEDTMMNMRAATGTRRVARIPEIVYCYRRNEQSVTGSKAAKLRAPAEHHAFWWNFAKSRFADQSEEWQIVWKIYAAATLPSMFVRSSGKFLTHPQIRPFVPAIAFVLKSGTPLAFARTVKFVMLATAFPFSLVPESVFRSALRAAYALLTFLRNRRK